MQNTAAPRIHMSHVLAFVKKLREQKDARYSDMADIIDNAKTEEEKVDLLNTAIETVKKYEADINYMKFELTELKLSKFYWEMSLLIIDRLPKAYAAYDIKMTYDFEPIDEALTDNRRKYKELSKTLFEEEDKREQEILDDRYRELMKQKTELMEKCPDINFFVRVRKLEYKNEHTLVVFSCPDHIVNILNDTKYKISEYKIALFPHIKE